MLLSCFYLVLGIFAWTFIEYLIHGPMAHGLGGFAGKMHLHHHRHMEDIFTTPLVWVPIALVLFLGQWALLGIQVAFPVTVGAVIGFLYYEYQHWRIHCREPGSDYERTIRAHHLAHHARCPRYCFGVTSRMWDHVFGTFSPHYEEDCRRTESIPVLTGPTNFARVYGLRWWWGKKPLNDDAER